MNGRRYITILLATFALFFLLANTLVLAHPGRGTGVQAGLDPYSFQGQQDPLQQTEAALANTGMPVRDLISITERLKLNGATNVPAVVNARPPGYKVGAKQSFYVADMGNRSYFTISTTLRYVTGHAYWYTADNLNVNQGYLQAAANTFETRIYPKDRRVFGPEVSPGIDNDTHVTVLVASIPGVGGYFSAADAYPRVVNPFSNQRDMIYMATLPTAKSGDTNNYFEGTLAHEFQHMIEWNVHRNRDVWFDEGAAEIAMYLNGYNPGGVDFAFTVNTDTQLNAWDDQNNTTPHYGASYLFLRYLMDRYGGENFMSALLKQNDPGTHGIDKLIKQAGNSAGFNGAFHDWTIANVLNDSRILGGRYSYSQGGRVQPGVAMSSAPAVRSGTVHQYAADYISLRDISGPVTIDFKGSAVANVIPVEPYSGRSFWYGNRQDSGDATLTREFDLTSTNRATLQFATWFDTERLFDFAYVEASGDDGKSWTVLKGRYTTNDNSNGTSFGPGWTGKSGVSGAGDGATAKWVQEQVDLGAYAGKRVLVRFEYITDEGYNRPGFAVDDVRVPEIGFSDDAESDAGWTADGFVRVGSHMPQHWNVTLIERGTVNRVREIPVDANGSGTIQFGGTGSGTLPRDAILVISPVAPKTTEIASFTVNVKRK